MVPTPYEGPFPGTRSRSAALMRNLYIKAQEYREKVEAADGNEDDMPPRDLEMKTLLEVFDGKHIVHNHTQRYDDILKAIRLFGEFGHRIVLHHVSEGGEVANKIAESGYPASIIVLDAPGGKLEAINLDDEFRRTLEEAGVPVIIQPAMMHLGGDGENDSFETAGKLADAGINFLFQSGYEV